MTESSAAARRPAAFDAPAPTPASFEASDPGAAQAG